MSSKVIFIACMIAAVILQDAAGMPSGVELSSSNPKENSIPLGDEPDVTLASQPAPSEEDTTSSSTPPPSSPATPLTSPHSTPTSSSSGSSRPATPTRQPAITSTISRIINDIFQIPISVLRAVNTMITNVLNPQRGNLSANYP